jgi:hypothetical protein
MVGLHPLGAHHPIEVGQWLRLVGEAAASGQQQGNIRCPQPMPGYSGGKGALRLDTQSGIFAY